MSALIQKLKNRCIDGVTNSVDGFRNLLEIFIGLNFVGNDVQDIQHELDPHYPSRNGNNKKQ